MDTRVDFIDLAMSSDNRIIAAGLDGVIRVWDPNDPNPQIDVLDGGRAEAPGPAFAVVGLENGVVVSGHTSGRVLVWNLKSLGSAPRRFNGHVNHVQSMIKLADGRVASAGWDSPVQIWDASNPSAPPVSFAGHSGSVIAVAQLPDGRLVSAGRDDDRILVWTVGSKDPEVEIKQPTASLAVLPNGHILAGGGYGQIGEWDPAHPEKPVAIYNGHSGAVYGLATLSSNTFASTGADGTVRVWDANAPKKGPIATGSHTRSASGLVALSANRLASSGRDLKVRIWQIE